LKDHDTNPDIVCPRPNAVKAVRSPVQLTRRRGVIAMNIAVILAFAFTITIGVALTAAFGFGLIPLGSIY
jgi:hypothetical protein